MIWYDIILNMRESAMLRSNIELCQGDNALIGFKFHLLDGYEEYSEESITSAKITLIQMNGNVISDDLIGICPDFEYVIKGTELQCPGMVVADVKLYANKARISSSRFTFTVKNDTLNNAAVASGTYIVELEKIVDEAQTILDAAVSKAESALEDIANIRLMGEATADVMGAVKYDDVTIRKNEDGQLCTKAPIANLLATEVGSPLDATMGTELASQITDLSNQVDDINTTLGNVAMKSDLPQLAPSRLAYPASQTPSSTGQERLKLNTTAISNSVLSIDANGTYFTVTKGSYWIYVSAIVKNTSTETKTYYIALDTGDVVGNRFSGLQFTLAPGETLTPAWIGQVNSNGTAKVGVEVNNAPQVNSIIVYALKIHS